MIQNWKSHRLGEKEELSFFFFELLPTLASKSHFKNYFMKELFFFKHKKNKKNISKYTVIVSKKTSLEQPFGNYLLFGNTCTEPPRMYNLSF